MEWNYCHSRKFITVRVVGCNDCLMETCLGVFWYTFQTQKSDLFINALAVCVKWPRKYIFIQQLDYVVW